MRLFFYLFPSIQSQSHWSRVARSSRAMRGWRLRSNCDWVNGRNSIHSYHSYQSPTHKVGDFLFATTQSYAQRQYTVMTLKASPLGNFKNFTRSMTPKASPLGNRWFERSEYPRMHRAR